MWKSNSTTADEQLTATRRKFKQSLQEKEKIWQQKAAHTAKLRSIRLAKELADKAALIECADRKSGRKTTKQSKPQKK